MIVAATHHIEDKKDIEKKDDFLSAVLSLLGDIFGFKWLPAVYNYVKDKPNFLLFIISGLLIYFLIIQPYNKNSSENKAIMTAITEKQQRQDTTLNMIRQEIKDGFDKQDERFNKIDNKLLNMDDDFFKLVHYVAKNPADEQYLDRTIIKDHQDIK